MAKRRPPSGTKLPVLKAGDFILASGNYPADPAHWWLGAVLWADGQDALVERSTINGDNWKEIVALADIRAVGSIADLVSVQRTASEAVRELERNVSDRQSELGRARDAVIAKLAELLAAGLQIIDSGPTTAQADDLRTADHQWREGRDGSVAIVEVLTELRDSIGPSVISDRLRERLKNAIGYAAALCGGPAS